MIKMLLIALMCMTMSPSVDMAFLSVDMALLRVCMALIVCVCLFAVFVNNIFIIIDNNIFIIIDNDCAYVHDDVAEPLYRKHTNVCILQIHCL